ncbi:MAG: hypothetical protein K0A98_04140 [Trueperaceae bacterium]|nr:hypothetical protein [Trueperaceae bacterium]
MQHIRKNPTRWLLAILIGLLAVSLSFASAANGIRVSAETDLEFEDDDDLIETMGIRFEIDGGLKVVVTNEGKGGIGDVYVPAFALETLPENALADYELERCVCSIKVIEPYPGGVIFVLEETSNPKAMSMLMAHLHSIGAQVGDMEASGRAFGFTADGVAYRAVFNADPNGTLVYLGN